MASLFNHTTIIETVELKDGLKKEVVRGGSGARPQTGDEVQAHYTGKLLTGEVFDSSVTRGKPFIFKIGLGMVIKGWDLGIASMSVGEKAVLTCSPDFAYGAAGAGNAIPPNSTLCFEVELLGTGGGEASWCSVV